MPITELKKPAWKVSMISIMWHSGKGKTKDSKSILDCQGFGGLWVGAGCLNEWNTRNFLRQWNYPVGYFNGEHVTLREPYEPTETYGTEDESECLQIKRENTQEVRGFQDGMQRVTRQSCITNVWNNLTMGWGGEMLTQVTLEGSGVCKIKGKRNCT